MNVSEDFKNGYKEGVKTAIKGVIYSIMGETDEEGIEFIKQIVADYE